MEKRINLTKTILAGSLIAFLTACSGGGNDNKADLAPSADSGMKKDKENHYIVVLKKVSADSEGESKTGDTKPVSLEDRVARLMNKVTSSDTLGLSKMGIKSVNKGENRLDKIYTKAINGFTANLTADAAAVIGADAEVEFIEKDQIVKANTVQASPDWGLDRLDQTSKTYDNQYNYTATGAGVHAYIIDTGIRASHEEFAGRVGNGYDFVDGDSIPDDCNGHGTHVAGTIGGTKYGVAKEVTLHALKVLACNGSGYNSDVIDAVEWVQNNHQSPSVVNMSLGGGVSRALDDAIRSAIRDGITFAVAAGNENEDASKSSPARVPEAITVGASNRYDKFAYYSNKGSLVDIVAPGTQITSAWFESDSQTNTISGTSMATPHVAGVLAQYFQSHRNASPEQAAADLVSHALSDKITDLRGGTVNLLLNNSYTAITPEQPQPQPATKTSWTSGSYANNVNISETLSVQGATELTVKINGETEANYDFITIFDHNGEEVAKYSGKMNKTLTVPGSSIRVQLTSDVSVSKTGVTVEVEGKTSATPAPIVEKTWTTGAYANNENRSKTLTIPGASSVSVEIKGETEKNFDYITLFDANGKQVAKLNGKIDQTVEVAGSSVRVQLTSDSSVTKSGVTVVARGTVSAEQPEKTSREWETGAYSNNANTEETLTIADATELTVTLSGEVEKNYDFITITNANGDLVGKYSGVLRETVKVSGDHIDIKFTSDSSVTKPGAKVTIRN